MNQTIEEINNNLRQLRDRLDFSIGLSESAVKTLKGIFKTEVIESTDACDYSICDGSGYRYQDGLKTKCPCYLSIAEQMDDDSDDHE